MTEHPSPHPLRAAKRLIAPLLSGDANDPASLLAQTLQRQAEPAAALLVALNAAPALQTAAYLHNFVYNNIVSLAQVAGCCGPQVEAYCADSLRPAAEPGDGSARGKARARQRVRYFAAAYHSPDMALLAVATLWGRQDAVKRGTLVQRHQGAEEARQVLLPLLEMLGMAALRDEVALWLWRLYEPHAERLEQMAGMLFAQVQQRLQPNLPTASLILQPVPSSLLSRGAPANAPVKTPFKSLPPLDITLLVDDEEACYRALYWLHRLFQPVDGAVIDYLAEGRINGERGLQTSVVLPLENQRPRLVFTICTRAMQEINRWGLAALHSRDRVSATLPNAWWNHAQEGYSQIVSAPLGALSDTLYVFSPQGELFRFHRGCTVVDYAYHVHTDLADQCHRFYINDEVVDPTTPLHHLDLVALEVDPRAPGPTQVWLNAAHTSRARNHIERFLKRRGLGIDQGQRILDQRLRDLEGHYGFNIPNHRITQATAQAMRRFKLSRVDELLAEVAAGRIGADRILHPLFADEVLRQVRLPRGLGIRPHQLLLAQCCRPRPGEEIVGLPSYSQGEIVRLRVHRADCVRAQPEEERLPLKWRLQPGLPYLAQLEVTAHDEDGLLGDALEVIYQRRPRATLHKVEAAADHGVARLRFSLETENAELLEQIGAALRDLPGRTIVEVRPLRLPPSELETAMHLSRPGIANPYSRLPVYEQAMFFGRSEELFQLYEWLRAGTGSIWLLGQKRVGKTSLLLYLRNSYLRDRGFVAAFVDFQLLGNLATGNPFFEVANAVYTELQADPRIGDLGAPLPGVFMHQPPVQLITYLRSIQSRLGADRLVLLLDEFSRTTDTYLHGDLDRSFFDAWRGVLQTIAPQIATISVIQQQTYNALLQWAQQTLNDPSWHLMELGEKLVLKSLAGQDVRRLIEWPMRNFLEYTPGTVDAVAQLTGGSPFLIQAFCFKLNTHLARDDRRQVETADIDAVRAEFMQPSESVFAHFLEIIKGSGHAVVYQLARLAHAGGPAEWEAIHDALPQYAPDKLRRTLAVLVAGDILFQPQDEQWQFCSRLFQEWLEFNPD